MDINSLVLGVAIGVIGLFLLAYISMKIDAAKDRRTRTERRLAMLELETQSLERRLTRHEDRLNSQFVRLDEMEEQIDDLEEDVEDLDDRFTDLCGDVESLERANLSLREDHDFLDEVTLNEAARLHDRVDELTEYAVETSVDQQARLEELDLVLAAHIEGQPDAE